MALKKCKECGNEISTDAKVCPYCGKKQKKVGCFSIGLLIVSIFVIIIMLSSIYDLKNKRKEHTALVHKEEILEIRTCPKDGINIRIGPGINYDKDESGQLIKGEKLYVLKEKNGWIRFRVTPKDVGWSGWVKKDLTILETRGAATKEDDDINALKNSGLLIKIDPQFNEAYINQAIWNELDYQTKENIGRTMAFYCGRKKGTNLNWVDIKDSYSGKKLARYSESRGFKVY